MDLGLQVGPQKSERRKLFCVFLPKSVPRALKSAPRALQERPKSSQEHPRASQERPKSVPRAPRSVPRAPKSAPRAEKHVKTRKNMQKPSKTQKNARKRAKIPPNDKKIHAKGFECTATTWMNFQCRPILRCTTSERCVSERFIVMDGYSSAGKGRGFPSFTPNRNIVKI